MHMTTLPGTPVLKKIRALLAAPICVLLAVAPADAFTLAIDYRYDTNGFFTANPQAATTLEAAADFFESIIIDQISDITPTSGNEWSQTFFHPGTLDLYTVSTSAALNDPVPNEIRPLSVAANTLVIYAGGAGLGGSLGVGGPGGGGASGSSEWLETVFERGENGASGTQPTDFAPWGGSISFATDQTWHFGLGNTVAGRNDFYSVALHELGHLLGLSLPGDTYSWDTYQEGSEFAGPNVIAVHGSAAATVSTTDLHWAAGTNSTIFGTTTPQQAVMTAGIVTGTRKVFTELDVAALRDVGWDVIPEPGTAALFSFGLLLLLPRKRLGVAST